MKQRLTVHSKLIFNIGPGEYTKYTLVDICCIIVQKAFSSFKHVRYGQQAFVNSKYMPDINARNRPYFACA